MRNGIATILVAVLGACPAWALPKYAQKENKPCGYCHVKPGGGGARNARGVWYAAHGHSFRGYAPAKPASKNKVQPNKKAKKR